MLSLTALFDMMNKSSLSNLSFSLQKTKVNGANIIKLRSSVANGNLSLLQIAIVVFLVFSFDIEYCFQVFNFVILCRQTETDF